MAEELMKPAYAIASHIISSLGHDTPAHWEAVEQGRIGIRHYDDAALSNTPFWGSRLEPALWQRIHAFTRASLPLSSFEQMALYSAREALAQCENANPDTTAFILSSTKGNIEWLGQADDNRLMLHTSAKIIAKELGITATPVVVAHACVSGVLATLYALRLLQSGRYEHVIVTGADRFTRFVLSGFQSFQAVAGEPCRPFDLARKGINLGEAAATIIFSSKKPDSYLAKLLSGATSNDANHISGPSRTGEELAYAITRAVDEARITAQQIGMISAHGTATLYNDEMESKAFDVAGLRNAPIHSFKGYVGHTLGAAGVVESAMIIESLQRQKLIPSAGFSELGVPIPLNITQSMVSAPIDYVLKTASGFGGCNAVAVWSK